MNIIIQAIEKLSNAMRIYNESSTNFHELRLIDTEEAINNLDRAFESKLENFHSLYDVIKDEFQYFDNADTSLLISIRNAIHHRNHELFKSWNSEMHLNSGMQNKAGATFLFVNHNSTTENISEYYYKLQDILDRIDTNRNSNSLDTRPSIVNRERLLNLLNSELNFANIIEYSVTKNFPLDQVYINIIPIYISAISKIANYIKTIDVELSGFDSKVYLEHFTAENLVNLEDITYKTLRVPNI
jgi:hypothetical protein